MPRLFTGIEIPAEIAGRVEMLRGGLSGARWIDPENYHLTLRFIGDVSGSTARDIAGLLERVKRKPFDVALTGLDSFGGRKPRAVIMRAEPSPGLMALQYEHEQLIQRAGLPPEQRKFTPHLTVARLRDIRPQAVANYLTVRGDFACPPFSVNRFVLFSAQPSRGGGPYVVEAAYDLVE